MNKESRSCNCITEHCAICFGCKTYKHCQCLPTVSTAKPASLSVKKRQLHEEYERKHIPRLKSVYDDKIGCEPSDGYDIYEYWDFGQHSGPKKSKRYIEHPLPGLAPTRMEKITPVASSSYTLIQKGNWQEERILENMENEVHMDAARPREQLIDYIVDMASVKISNVPELAHRFENTSATAMAIIVEEYIKQCTQETKQGVKCTDARYASEYLFEMMRNVVWPTFELTVIVPIIQNHCREIFNESDMSTYFTEPIITQHVLLYKTEFQKVDTSAPTSATRLQLENNYNWKATSHPFIYHNASHNYGIPIQAKSDDQTDTVFTIVQDIPNIQLAAKLASSLEPLI